jgi:putative endonuclease
VCYAHHVLLDSGLRRNDDLGDPAMDRRQPCVYMLASQRNGTLYVGVTSDLIKRIWQHKHHIAKGFTSEHHIHLLVWYELHPNMESAITREKVLKGWKRAWKIRLIEEANPEWGDLYPGLL